MDGKIIQEITKTIDAGNCFIVTRTVESGQYYTVNIQSPKIIFAVLSTINVSQYFGMVINPAEDMVSPTEKYTLLASITWGSDHVSFYAQNASKVVILGG